MALRPLILSFQALALALATSAASEVRPSVPVATLVYVEGAATVTPDGGVAAPAQQGQKLRTGDRLEAGSAFIRLEFPWMKASLAPGSVLRVPAEMILSVVLESGRLEIIAEEDSIKVVTAEGEVRGRGRAILRRSDEMTRVMVIDGLFAVESALGGLPLRVGEGARVLAGGALDGPHPLPVAPTEIRPPADTVYVPVGESVELSWQGPETRFHVEMLAMHIEETIFAVETTAASVTVDMPWVGTFRWRVTAIDERGLESAPSVEGTVCVIDPDAGKDKG